MKPHRIRMTHNLLLNYGLYRKMEIYVSFGRFICIFNNFDLKMVVLRHFLDKTGGRMMCF